MSTLAPPSPAQAAATSGTALTPPLKLWPGGFEIPILALTGEPAAGKTLFALQVAKDRTKVLDFELGSATYEASMGFDRTDVPAYLATLYQNGNFQPIHAFLWFRKFCETIPAGKYDALVIDDISQIEDGCTEWVRKNPGYFGKTANQFATSEPQVWGCMKVLYKQILCALAPKVQTVCLISHMRDEFKGGKPTGRREPKGKETILELATLYLELRRFPDAKGIVPAKPIARVIKSRLTHAHLNAATGDFDLSPVLPPVIEDCTPARIRHLMLNPVNYDRLKPGERIHAEVMSEDEKLRAQQQIAADTARGQEAARDRMAMEREVAIAEALAKGATLPAASVSSDLSGVMAAAKVEKTAEAAKVWIPETAPTPTTAVAEEVAVQVTGDATDGVGGESLAHAAPAEAVPHVVAHVEPVATVPADAPISEDQKAKLAWLRGPEALNIEFEKWKAFIRGNFGFESAVFLTYEQADTLIAGLSAKLEAKKIKAGQAEWLDKVSQIDPSKTGAAPVAVGPVVRGEDEVPF